MKSKSLFRPQFFFQVLHLEVVRVLVAAFGTNLKYKYVIMKKELLFKGLLILSFISCNNNDVAVLENDSITDGAELVVRAVMGDDNATKTAVQSNGTDIYWTPGDAINLFYGNYSSGQFTTSITSPAATADFTGTISAVTGTIEATGAPRSFWGVYPYNASNSCDGSGVTLTIPGTQSGVAGTFADNLNPTVAKSLGLDLTFYNVGSWFIFSVSRNDIASVTLNGNNSETLVGKVSVTMENSRPKVTGVTNGSTEITMTPTDSVCFKVGKYYYMVLIPQTLDDGYSLTMVTSEGSSATCVVTGEKEFSRSNARGKLLADKGLSFPEIIYVDLGLSVKWAKYNIGATSPEEYGDFYAWGEIEPYYKAGYARENPQAHWKDGKTSGYAWPSYKWCNGQAGSLTKYCSPGGNYGYNGFYDYLFTLEMSDDVARQKWGGSWRLPSSSEFKDLIDNCTWTWTTLNGINGYRVTSNISGYTDRSIFLPAAGKRYSTIFDATYCGYYWSRSLYTESPLANSLDFTSKSVSRNHHDRFDGFSVRPVCP